MQWFYLMLRFLMLNSYIEEVYFYAIYFIISWLIKNAVTYVFQVT